MSTPTVDEMASRQSGSPLEELPLHQDAAEEKRDISLIKYTHSQLPAKSKTSQLSRFVNPSFHSNHSRRNKKFSKGSQTTRIKLPIPIEKAGRTFPWVLSKPLVPQLPPWMHRVEPDSLGQWMTDGANCLHRAILRHPTYTKFTPD